MTDGKELITFEEAVKRIPEGDNIHTFKQSGPFLIGADSPRAELLEAMQKAAAIEVTGDHAQSMNHGLAIRDGDTWLFIATTSQAAVFVSG